MDPGWYVALAALALSGLFRLVRGGFREKGIQQELADRPRARIGEASGAGLHVRGRVQARGDLLTAPLSGRRCVAFQLRVEELKEQQNRLARWQVLLDLQDAQSFGLADETGDALVDAGTPFVLALTFDEQGNDLATPIEAARMKTLDGLLGPPPTSWPASRRRLRYGEGIINEGDLVSVAGSGARETNAAGRSANFRDPPTLLMLRGTDEDPLWISNAPDFGPVGYD